MMKVNKTGAFWKILRAGVAFSLLSVGVAMVASKSDQTGSETMVAGTSTKAGWGSESLQSVRTGFEQISPFALANACGMGASSCFKCHNGKRAAAPGMDAAKSPWHVHHAKVNNSCVGCHKGNPRLMKEEMAHAGMINAPKGGAASCAGCHKSDMAKVEAVYQSVGGK